MLVEIMYLDLMLKVLKRMPDIPPSEIGIGSWNQDRHHPFSPQEIYAMKSRMRSVAPSSYYGIFPEEKPAAPQDAKGSALDK
jgi:hypothetical protein